MGKGECVKKCSIQAAAGLIDPEPLTAERSTSTPQTWTWTFRYRQGAGLDKREVGHVEICKFLAERVVEDHALKDSTPHVPPPDCHPARPDR